MNPLTEAIPFIDANLLLYDIEWRNTRRVSKDWKVKLYEQTKTGLQMAIYDRATTLVRVERPVVGIHGVTEKNPCPKSHSLESGFSNFKGGKGLCLAVEDLSALERLLNQYFSLAVNPSTLEGAFLVFEQALAEARSRSSAERRARLATATKKAQRIVVQTTAFLRSPDVVLEVLERAAGRCEACKCVAPFLKASTGEPYLEVHHVVRLADDGDDTVENSVALCPNCHRKEHFG